MFGLHRLIGRLLRSKVFWMVIVAVPMEMITTCALWNTLLAPVTHWASINLWQALGISATIRFFMDKFMPDHPEQEQPSMGSIGIMLGLRYFSAWAILILVVVFR